ncbi:MULTISPECIES: STAS domain-containing protein [Streptomyces]|uniref:Anti-sigma factor antagonist n=1 Tax=Streptomyces solicathayae TaxID=3081768 RepID=A0ABZ0M368_9ACTN|nr:STAS domain-containing protein [Streptomyces sp. HUAS YS2]WOX26027.1 STAS domain-containing protein [Streptomyces sp. HUAS YS2]
MDGDSGQRFGVEVTSGDGAVVLALSGELDHDTAEPLRVALAEQIEAGARRIVVDCARLRFCDSTGLNALLRARLQAQENGGRVELADLRPPVSRMFEITGAHTVFQVHADLAAALASADRRPERG